MAIVSASTSANAPNTATAEISEGPPPALPASRPPVERPLWLRVHQPDSGSHVITAGGTLDSAGADEFADVLRRRIDATFERMVVDFSAVSFLTTAGVVALLEAGWRAQRRGISLVLVTGNRVVDRLLELMEVTERFVRAPSVASALATGADPAGIPQPR
ncbi:anti-anti-sigma factor [Halopolyspora algeriensis]|uniref:Anti-anti-sigma factor n=1 Tax=Halopolyspora algeriensis TaxID=1500506 RepID=A0A368VN15_9ACTN|nr:STAS domain-containing protein [Halopolyspora algeriensis]RCW42874.1 anti-anti-sigma factor [Halopolyspora algeriensis]TQM56657.1 anti-anti-sigma factor [Halopolyspora algeriensis]